MTTTDIRSALLTIAAEIERGNHRSAERQIGKLIDSLPPPTTGAVADLVASLPVVEYMPDGARWLQRRNDRVRVWTDSEWTAAIYPPSVADDRCLARLVPADQADADPATRGPIGGAPANVSCADPFGCDPAYLCFGDPAKCSKRPIGGGK